MLEFPVFLVSLIGQTALTGQTALIGPGLSDVGSSHVFLGSGDALAQRSLFSGWWAQAVDPEFGEAVMLQSGAQTRNSEEGPSSSRMQEKAAGNHGMQGALGDGGGAGGVGIWGPSEPRPSRRLPSQLPRAALGKNAGGQDNGRTEECAGPVARESEAGTPALRASRNHFRSRVSVCGAKVARPGRCGPGHEACREEGLVLGWMSRPG